MLKKLALLLLSILLLQSCNLDFSKTHSISPEAYDLIPYKGGEKLIFESDKKQRDTIFVNGITIAAVRGGDPFSINPDRFEHLRIDYKTTIRNTYEGLLYLDGSGDYINLRFEFNAGHSRLFGNQSFYKSEFDAMPSITLKAMDSTYTDVKTIHSGPYYEDRPERILNFYWSNNSGLLGWDTPTDTWRLIEIK